MFEGSAGPPSVTARDVEPTLESRPISIASPHNLDISARHMGDGSVPTYSKTDHILHDSITIPTFISDVAERVRGRWVRGKSTT
jgi:hypothetical protein